MKPTILQGHTRPIKAISFNNDSSKILSASNDRSIICWDVEKKEKEKSFPHSAAISSFALSSCNSYFVSGDNTGTVSICDFQKGITLTLIEGDPTETVKSIAFSEDSKTLLIAFSGRTKNAASKINAYLFEQLIAIESPEKDKEIIEEQGSSPIKESIKNDGPKEKESIYNQESIYSINLNANSAKNKGKKSKEKPIDPILLHKPNKIQLESLVPIKVFNSTQSKYIKAVFVDNSKSILAAKENGCLELIGYESGEVTMCKEFHSEPILDMDYNENLRLILTASSDGYACVVSVDTFQTLYKFHPENPTRNINSCRLMIIPNPFANKKKVNVDDLFVSGEDEIWIDKFKALRQEQKLPLAVFGGGQDSKLVTTTHPKDGGFEIIVHELVEGSQLLYFQSHFGPINALGCSTNEKACFASGSEDATVRLYNLDEYIRALDS